MTWPLKSTALISRIRSAVSATVLFAASALGQTARVEIAAHRGGYAVGPENTCAAFRACEGFADRIEFDVRTSADGELVVIHDETVNRTTRGFGDVTNVADLTLAQLQALDAGSAFSSRFAGERIPTLAEALRALPPGVPAMVHCKDASAKTIVDVLRAENALSNVCIACGGLDPLFAVHQIDPTLELAYEGAGAIGTNNIAVAQRMGVRTFLWFKDDVTPEMVDRVHAAGMRVAVAASGSTCRKYAEMGVDRILSDDPKIAREAALRFPESVPLVGSEAAAESRPPSPAPNVAQLPPRFGPAGVSPAALVRDLVAHWKLDDGLSDPATVNAEDAAGGSRGRLVGFSFAPGWISGAEAVASGALRLDGVRTYVRIPPTENLDIGAPAVSLSLWIRLDKLPSQLDRDFAFIYGSDLAAYELYLDRAHGELRFTVADASGQTAAPGIPESQLHVGVWHHVVGVYDGGGGTAGKASIYLDGRLQDVHVGADATPGRGLTGSVLPGQFAALGRPGDRDDFYFAGAMDDVAIWRRPLALDEIVWIQAAGTEGRPVDAVPGAP